MKELKKIKPIKEVPEETAKKFLSLHKSLSMTLNAYEEENKKLARGEHKSITLLLNPNISMHSAEHQIRKQIQAIERLVTNRELYFFWVMCDAEKAEKFYQDWHEMFSEWQLKPRMTNSEKKEYLENAVHLVDELKNLTDKDTSLQECISYAIIEALNTVYPETTLDGDNCDAYGIMNCKKFLYLISKNLSETLAPDFWKNPQLRFPTQINQESAESQYFIKSFAKATAPILGVKKHAKLTKFINILLDLDINKEQVRNQARYKTPLIK